MGVIDKFLNVMKLGGDYDDYDDDYDDYDDDYDDDKPAKKTFRRKKDNNADDTAEDTSKAKSTKVTAFRTSTKKQVSSMEVCVIKPTSYNDSREIAETLLSNRTVVLNFEGLDVDVAQKIIDFTSGACYAVGGNLQKVSAYIFLVTPKGVDISGDLQDILSGSLDIPTVYDKL